MVSRKQIIVPLKVAIIAAFLLYRYKFFSRVQDNTKFPLIENERLLLRELQPDDAEDYFSYFSDNEVTR